MFILCLGSAWTIWDGGGVWFDNVSATFFVFNALPVPMLNQILKINVLRAWELTFGEFWLPIPRHFQAPFLGGPRVTFGSLLAYFWVVQVSLLGVLWDLWDPLECAWRPRATLLGDFGFLGLS